MDGAIDGTWVVLAWAGIVASLASIALAVRHAASWRPAVAVTAGLALLVAVLVARSVPSPFADESYEGDVMAIAALLPALVGGVLAAASRAMVPGFVAGLGAIAGGVGVLQAGGSGTGWDWAAIFAGGVILVVCGARGGSLEDAQRPRARRRLRLAFIVVGILVAAIPLALLLLLVLVCAPGGCA